MKLPFLAEGEAFWLAHFDRPNVRIRTINPRGHWMVSYLYQEHTILGTNICPDDVKCYVEWPFEECRA